MMHYSIGLRYTLTMSNEQDLQPLLDAQQSQLQISLTDSSSIDNKALAILAGNVAVLLFVAQANFVFGAWWHGAVLLVPFFISIIMTGVTFWPRRYKGPLIELENHPEYLELSREDLVLQLLADAQQAMEYNLHLNDKRWSFCVAAIISASIGVVVLFAIL